MPSEIDKAKEKIQQLKDVVKGELGEEFLKTSLTVEGSNGETTFSLGKMPATTGWDVLEEIREASTAPLKFDEADPRDMFQAVVLSLPKPFTRRLRDKMFAYVTFQNRMQQTPEVLAGHEEEAFDAIGAEPIEIYDLFIRSLAVNFTPSFLAMLDKILSMMTRIGKLQSIGISPPSSPPQ